MNLFDEMKEVTFTEIVIGAAAGIGTLVFSYLITFGFAELNEVFTGGCQ